MKMTKNLGVLALAITVMTTGLGFSSCATGGKTAGRTVANVNPLAQAVEVIAANSTKSRSAVTSAVEKLVLAQGKTIATLTAAESKAAYDKLVQLFAKGDSKMAADLGISAKTGSKEFAQLNSQLASVGKMGDDVGATGATGYGTAATDAEVDAAISKVSVKEIRQGLRRAAQNIKVMTANPEVYDILRETILTSADFSAEAKQVLLGELECVANGNLNGKTELANGLAIIKKIRGLAKGGMSVQEVASAWDNASVEVIGRSTRLGLKKPCDFIHPSLASVK